MTIADDSPRQAPRVDVAIIGGGVIGYAIGFRLSQAGARICLIDDNGPRASHAAAGMLAGSFEAPPASSDAFVFDFSRAALTEWRRFASDLCAALPGHAVPGVGSIDRPGADDRARARRHDPAAAFDYRVDGILGVAVDTAAAARLQRDAFNLTARGVPARYLTAPALLALEPALAHDVAGGVCVADEGQVDPRRLLAVLQAVLASRAGVALRPVRALNIAAAGSGVMVTCADGAAVMADRVVIASGAARALVASVPIIPVKGEALSVLPPPGAMPRRVVRGASAYLCPKADGRLVIGATEQRNQNDLAPDDAAIAALRAAAERLVPGLAGAPELERWAGVRPGTRDGLPILGPVAEPIDGPVAPPVAPHVVPSARHREALTDRVFLALGHYRNGILWAALTARLLADRLAGLTPDPLGVTAFDAFSPQRFSTGSARTCGAGEKDRRGKQSRHAKGGRLGLH